MKYSVLVEVGQTIQLREAVKLLAFIVTVGLDGKR